MPELHLAVIGNPISHSLSPAMHATALEKCGIKGTYDRIRVPPKNLTQIVGQLRRKGFDGFNVTIPHKEAIVPLLQSLDEHAQRIRAVNTVARHEGGFRGYNTDASGFGRILDGLPRDNRSALILGAGGAARGCLDALLNRNWAVTMANRTADRALLFRKQATVIDLRDAPAVQSALKTTSLLVNATPIGMNRQEESPLSDRIILPPSVTVIDLVYSPLETRLLLDAQDAGCPTIDGLALLAAQAADSFFLWTGRRLDDDFFRQAALEGALMDRARAFRIGQFGPPSGGAFGW